MNRSLGILLVTVSVALPRAAPAQDLLFVSSWEGQSVSVVDLQSGAIDKSFGVSAQAAGILQDSFGRLLVARGGPSDIASVDSVCGQVAGVAYSGSMNQPRNMVMGPDGRLYVCSRGNDRVVAYDMADGSSAVVVDSGLDGPVDVAFAPSGELIVANVDDDSVRVFDVSSGALIGTLLSQGPLDGPTGLVFTDGGTLLVSSSHTDQVLAYSWPGGAFQGVFAEGGGLDNPIDLQIDPAGDLLVASNETDQVLAFDGITGSFLGVVAVVNSPWGLTVGSGTPLPEAPGFEVSILAELEMPLTLSPSPSGDLFVGRQTEPVTGVAAHIRKVDPSGAVSDFGDSPTLDPDSVVFDATGSITGTPGSVVVAGICGSGVSCFDSIDPAGLVAPLLGPVMVPENPYKMVIDSTGRMLISDNDSAELSVAVAGNLSVLTVLPEPSTGLAVDSADRIFVASTDGDVRLLDASGAMLDPSVATGLGDGPALAVGPEGDPWNGDLFALDASAGALLRVDQSGEVSTVGTGFSRAQSDLAFGADGALYVSQVCSNRILKIEPLESAWSNQGCELAGLLGAPVLEGSGSLASGSPNAVELSAAAPSAVSGLFLALGPVSPQPFKGGTLKPVPFLLPPVVLPTGPAGSIAIPFAMPPGIPPGVEIWVQWAIQDGGAPNGMALSNAILGVTP